MIGRLDATVKSSGGTSLTRLPAVVGGAARVGSGLHEPDTGDLVAGVQQAVDRLIQASSVQELFALAAAAAARIGFTRVLFFSRLDHGTWLAHNAYTADDPDFAEQLVAFGTAHSRRLGGQLLESEMLLSGTPNPGVRRAIASPGSFASWCGSPAPLTMSPRRCRRGGVPRWP